MSQALADRLNLGITYRQLDHWTRLGLLHPAPYQTWWGELATGTGHKRRWPESELAIAASMGRLVKLGLSLDRAVKVARAGRESEVRFALTGGQRD